MHKSLNRYTALFILVIVLSGCLAKEINSIRPGANNTELYLNQLRGKRVAVMANQSSLIGDYHLVDSLLAFGINIQIIFTPEHGFSGKADAGASVSNDFYSTDSIPVISLYGKRKKPLKSDLEGVDIVVFDLQDLGVRVYTYIGSMHYMMEACAENKIPLIVLDRPNPNGHYIAGPVLKEEYKSFVGMHPVPFVHGMTIGEFALMINGEYWLEDSVQCSLQVIPCKNYDHSKFYSLPVAPSPNLRSMHAIYLYPSLVLFEGTVVSVGRGTNSPFTVFGHPDYSKKDFSFTPVSMAGSSLYPKLEDEKCFGEDLGAVSLDTLRHEQLNLNYLMNIYADLERDADFFIPFFDKLAGSDQLRKQITQGFSIEKIQESWSEDLESYKKIRIKYLLYPDFE